MRQPNGYGGLQGYFVYEGHRRQGTLTSRRHERSENRPNEETISCFSDSHHYCLRVGSLNNKLSRVKETCLHAWVKLSNFRHDVGG